MPRKIQLTNSDPH